MELLFLDTYYVDGIEVVGSFYRICRDFVIPIFAGLVIPVIILFLTSWSDAYKKTYKRFSTREILFHKIEMIIAENQVIIRKLRDHLRSVSFDRLDLIKYSITSKNTVDLYNMDFEVVLELFRNDFEAYPDFREKFTNYETAIVELNDMRNSYDSLCDSFNLENIELINNCYELDQQMKEILGDDTRDIDYSDTDDRDDYFLSLDSVLWEISTEMSNSERNRKFQELKNLACGGLPDYINLKFVHSVDELIVNFGLVKKNVDDFTLQIKHYIESIEKNNERLGDFSQKIRVKLPKRWAVWKYWGYK